MPSLAERITEVNQRIYRVYQSLNQFSEMQTLAFEVFTENANALALEVCISHIRESVASSLDEIRDVKTLLQLTEEKLKLVQEYEEANPSSKSSGQRDHEKVPSPQ
jgi:hypothetical protein